MNIYAIKIVIGNRSSGASHRISYFHNWIYCDVLSTTEIQKGLWQYWKEKSNYFYCLFHNWCSPAFSLTSTLIVNLFCSFSCCTHIYIVFLIHVLLARFFIWWEMWFLLSATVWPHLILHVLSPSIFLQICITISLQMNSIPLYVYTIFTIRSPVDRQLGWLQYFDVVNAEAVNMDVNISILGCRVLQLSSQEWCCWVIC